MKLPEVQAQSALSVANAQGAVANLSQIEREMQRISTWLNDWAENLASRQETDPEGINVYMAGINAAQITGEAGHLKEELRALVEHLGKLDEQIGAIK